jgi:hypothetical protein
MTSGANGARLNALLSFSGSPLLTRRSEKPSFPGEQLVIVPSPFFPHKLSKGYSNPATRVVETVNGIRIKNLLHLVQVLRDATEPFIVVEFAGRSQETVVFPRPESRAATNEILSDNDVRDQGSPDTLAVWNEKPAP